MKKRLTATISVALAIFLIFSTNVAVLGSITNSVPGNIRVKVDGTFIAFADVQPQMVNGRVLVPVRGVFEYMGFVIDWIPEARIATLVSSDFFITISADGSTFTVNTDIITPDVPQQLIGGRLMLPLRAVAEATGSEPYWDSVNRIAVITTQRTNDTVSTTPSPTPTSSPAVTSTPSPAPTAVPSPIPTPTPGANNQATGFLTESQLREMAAQQPSPQHPVIGAQSVSAFLAAGVAYKDIQSMFEQELIRLVNVLRAEYGLPPLVFHSALGNVARLRAQESIDYGYISGHISHATGLAHTDHARAMGLNVGFAGENWTAGSYSTTPAGALWAWTNSPAHRAPILSGLEGNVFGSDIIHIGVGFAFSPNGGRQSGWTLWVSTAIS